jgi:hypothetical protein
MNDQIDKNSGVYTFNILDNPSVFYICLFDVRLPDDELKNIEKCRSINTCEFDLNPSSTNAYFYTLCILL